MGKNKEVRLRKIPLEKFLETLMDLYEEGLEYIDIVGEADKEQDIIGIIFTKDYMSEEMRKRHEDFENDIANEIISKDIDLSNEDDLNQII